MQVVDWISKQAGKLADKFENYKFYVHSTPDDIDSSTRLFLNAYVSRDKEALVACTYKWCRIRNGILSDCPEFKGNTFLCEPADVGSIIQAEITSIDEQYPGTALLKYGPVAIDVSLKQSIEGALSTGEGKFQVDIGHEDRSKQCTITVSDDYMRIAHCNSNHHFKFYYCHGEPIINPLSKDPVNISMVFPQKYETQTIKFLAQLWNDVNLSKQQKSNQQLLVSLKFINRRFKDQFLFVVKGFIAKRQLKNSSVIKKIEKMDVDDSNLHFMLQIESLRKDLLKLYNLNKKAQQEKMVYMDETFKLEKQIEDIISSYTKLIEGKFKTREEFQESFIDFENKKDHAVNHKYQKIEDENAKLKEYIREKMDCSYKDTPIINLKEEEGRVDYTTNNPFTKKKEPFAELIMKKDNQAEYENLLENLSVEEELVYTESNINKLKDGEAKQKKLEDKLSRSMVKIEKLEGEIYRLNHSSNEANLSMSQSSNISALDISTSKVVDEKYILEKKYAKIKEDYAKLKSAYQQLKSTPASSADPVNHESTSNEVLRLNSALAAMEREKDCWKQKAQSLAGELRQAKEESVKSMSKLQRKVVQLSGQLQMSRKNGDVMNRSQHLSMEMDEYNSQQNEILKEQNSFLMNENERLTKMCEKYKHEYKKIKESSKNAVSESLLI